MSYQRKAFFGTIILIMILSFNTGAGCINGLSHQSMNELSTAYIDVDNSGQLFIGWEKYDNEDFMSETKRIGHDYRQSMAIVDENGSVFIRELPDFPNTFFSLNFIVDHSDNIHIISKTMQKLESMPSEDDISYMRYLPDLTPASAPLHLTEYEAGIHFPEFTVDGANDISIAWQKGYSPKGTIMLMKINNGGEIMINETPISEGEANEAPQIFSDSAGFVHIRWDRIHGETQYCKIASNGSIIEGPSPLKDWSIIRDYPVVRDNNSKLLYLDRSGVVDSMNNIHILKFDRINSSVLYFKLNTTGALLIDSTPLWVVKGMIPEVKIKIDCLDRIHLVWWEDNAIYYTRLDTNGTKLIDRMLIAKGGTSSHTAPSFLDFGIAAILIATVATVMYFKKARG